MCGQNALGVGSANRANLTIGRAVRLVVQNIGGAKPGFSEMATVGSPLKVSLRHPGTQNRHTTLIVLHELVS